MPPATLEAFRDHGVARSTLEEDVATAQEVMATIRVLELSLDKITGRLLRDGVDLFVEAFDKLLGVIEQQRCSTIGKQADSGGGVSAAKTI